jgi:hypothetical protein
LIRQGCRVVEVPIVFTDRIAGASKLSRRIVFEAMLVVWRLRFSRGAPERRGIEAEERGVEVSGVETPG